MLIMLSLIYIFFFFSRTLLSKIIFFFLFYVTTSFFFLYLNKNIFGFLLLLINASALLIFIIFILLSINLKIKTKPKKYFLYFLLIKFTVVGHNTFKNSICLGFNKYYTLIDNNSSLVFSLNDLQKLGYLMYYYFFI